MSILKKYQSFLPWMLVIFFLVASSPAFSQTVPSPLPDAAAEYNSTVNIFKTVGKGMFEKLKGIALYVFYSLFTIQFVVQISSLAIKGGDMGDYIEFMVKQILYFGFFYWLVLNANDIGNIIVESFATAGKRASGSKWDLSPESVMIYGLEMTGHILKNMSAWPTKIGFSILAGLSALIILIITSFMAVLIALALIESYIIVGCSVLFMAFGGSVWTKEIAISMLRYAFSIGAKIFMMYIILGASFNSLGQWNDAAGGINPIKNLLDIMTLVSLLFFILILLIRLPEIIQAVINGSTSSSTGAASVVTAGMAVAAAKMAIEAASKLSAAQTTGPAIQSLAGQSGMTAMRTLGSNTASVFGYGVRFLGNTAKNLGSSSMKDLGGRLTGRSNFGTMGGRMAVNMAEQLHDLKKPSTEEQNSSGETSDYSAQQTGNIRPQETDTKEKPDQS